MFAQGNNSETSPFREPHWTIEKQLFFFSTFNLDFFVQRTKSLNPTDSVLDF